MRTRSVALHVAWTLASGAIACETGSAPPDGLVDFTFENDTRELCAGTASHLERFIERVFAFLEAELPADFVIPIRVVHDPPCSASACYVPADRTVYIRDLDWIGSRPSGVLRHEVTHAIVDRLWGDGISFFSEGLVEALAQSSNWSLASKPPAAIEEMLDSPANEVDDDAAAQFVRFLIDTRGLASFEQVYRGTVDLAGAPLRAAIEHVYDQSFASLEAEYLSGEPRCRYQLDLCDTAAAERVGDRWSTTMNAACDDREFYGSAGSDDLKIAAHRTIEVEVAGLYHLHTFYDPPPTEPEYPRSEIALVRCGPCDSQHVALYKQTDREIELAAGLYTFEVIMPFATAVTLRLERLGDDSSSP